MENIENNKNNQNEQRVINIPWDSQGNRLRPKYKNHTHKRFKFSRKVDVEWNDCWVESIIWCSCWLLLKKSKERYIWGINTGWYYSEYKRWLVFKETV